MCGPPGAGKSLFVLQFLVNGVTPYVESGVFLTFEETGPMWWPTSARSTSTSMAWKVMADCYRRLDQQPGVAAAHVDDVTKCAPGVGNSYSGRIRHQPGSHHQRVKRRCPPGVGRQVVPERPAELTRERGLAGTNGVQQLDKAQIGAPDSTVQIDPGSHSF